ncbi:MAG: RES family NAD+ phosphorylase [Acidimicrobiales bacterium]
MAIEVDSTIVEGRWLRHVPAGVDPARRPDPPGDNRWQHGRAVDALYLADSASCAWAEWYRHLAEAGMPPHVSLPRDLWSYDVSSLAVADLSDPDRLARVGLGRPRPGRRSWPAFQAVGEQLARQGWRGLLVPSAARPASSVLVVFLLETMIPAELVADSYRRVTEPPAPPTGMRT